ncbi:HOL1 Protein HOL1 [Candida maltosa Xu316]|uniref:Major-facilitator-like ion transporter, putative n=1 Tax=Candida maltosa (strain Xu316) TaxID=1245528 RepID=M3HHE3_CANMX|nr:Major-facilitator-like ion transporter, putative [Candida maltosa Xu316]
MPDLDFVLSPAHTNVQMNDSNNDEFIPGTLNIYSLEVTSPEDQAGVEKTVVKTKGNIILFPQPSNSVNDPLNWSKTKKLLNFSLLIFITCFTAATSNIAGSVQDQLNEIYDISYNVFNTGAGVLFIGIGLGSYLLFPSASLYGRKLNYVICIALGAIGAAWFARTTTVSDAIWSQLFVGISEACAEAQVQLSLSELFFAHRLGSVLTCYIVATSIGTYLAPLFGSVIVENIGFRWVGWSSFIMSCALLVVILLFMDETLFDRSRYVKSTINGVSPATSFKDQEEKKKKDGNDQPRKESTVGVVKTHEVESSEESDVSTDEGQSDPPISYWKGKSLITLAPNLRGTGVKQYCTQLYHSLKLFAYPPVVWAGLCWGIQNTLLTFYLTVEDDQYYDPPYNYGDLGVGIMNIPCLIGAVIGCLFAGTLSDYFTIFLAKRNNGIQEAENRLWFVFFPAIIGPVGLILFAVGTDQLWHWGPTYVGLGFIGFAYGSAGDISMSYLMDAYPDMILETMVMVSLLNNLLACVFTFVCSLWLEASGNTVTFIILAVIEFVIMMSGGVFIYFGKRIRIWTKPWYLEFCESRDKM